MKKTLFILLALVNWSLGANATHNYGGYITYNQISNLTYEVTIITYTETSSSADRDYLLPFWGDGSSDTIPRVLLEFLPFNRQKNTYTGIHSYSSPGNYKIWVTDPNRTDNIINIPNSINERFHIESELIIPNVNDYNNSVSFLAPELFRAYIGEAFSYNLSAFDSDGDLLSYELDSTRTENGQSIDGYFLPDSVSINNLTGELTWNSPQTIGKYIITVKVTECRNGFKIGSVLRDIHIIVSPANNQPVEFGEVSAWPIDGTNNYSITIAPTDSVHLPLSYTDVNNSVLILSAFGEPFINGNSGNFQFDSTSGAYIRRIFKWNPTSDQVRCNPYTVTFRGGYDGQGYYKDISLLIYVHDQSTSGCNYTCNSLLSADNSPFEDDKSNILVYPNPFNHQTTIRISNYKEMNFQTLTIYDLHGKKVSTLSIVNQEEIPVSRNNLPSGIYSYLIQNDQNKVVRGKIVITD